jgi:hypothetical protein
MSYIPLPVDEYGNVSIGFGDSAALDAFQRLRVSMAHRLFDSQQEYGLDTLRTWDCTANGTLPTILSPNGSVTSGSNAVGPRNTNTRMTPITCSSTNGHYSILQSRQYVRYIPGFSHLVLITGVFATASNPTPSLVIRSSTSGSVDDSTDAYARANWYDKFDGTGPSGITIDFTKTQIMFIGAQWLGVGRVIVGFDIDGRLWPAMFFLHANEFTVPYTQTFNLPVRMEAQTVTTTTETRVGYFDNANGVFLKLVNTGAGGTMNFVCCSVQSEGADEARGYPQSQNPGIAAIAVTTRRPIFSIRPAATFQGLTNRAHIELEDFWLTASTNSSIFEIVIGGTLGGASWLAVGNSVTAGSFVVGIRYKILSIGTTDFTLIGAASNTVGVSFIATGVGVGTGTATPENSCAEYDISATTITGGGTAYVGEITTGSGIIRGTVAQVADFRNPLVLSQINSLTATQTSISVVCTSTSGTSNVRAGMNWHEQTI